MPLLLPLMLLNLGLVVLGTVAGLPFHPSHTPFRTAYPGASAKNIGRLQSS